MIKIIYPKQNKRSHLLLIVLVFFTVYCRGQEKTTLMVDMESVMNYADAIYGSDDMLINGRIYVPQHSLAEGHPYFEITDWITGDIFVQGRRFEGLRLKFDIELDEFILYIEDKYNRKNYIVLNKHYVDSVYLGKYLFVNTSVLGQVSEEIGYAELVYNEGLIFLVKYKKEFKKEYSDSKPYGEYSKQNSDRYIGEAGRLVKVNTKKAFLSYFGTSKKDINRFMKKQKINYKKANSGILNNLLEYCNANRDN